MSDAAGLSILFVLSMILPVAVIIYLKWEDIVNWNLRRKNGKGKDEEDIYREPSKFKKWLLTFFGKDQPKAVVSEEVVVDTSNKTTQQILAEQRKKEDIAKKRAKAAKEAEKKAQDKANEKEAIKNQKKNKKTKKAKK